MKITEYGPIRTASDVKKKRGVSSSGSFADLLAGEIDDTGSVLPAGDVAAPASIDNLLALQEISEDEVQRRKLMRQGQATLDSLEVLRRQVLVGRITRHTLEDIKRQVSMQRHGVSDPRLLAIMDEIDLRAAVELAKLEMSQKAP